MAFTARSRAEIRDALLQALVVRFAAIGKSILITEGSDAYMTMEAVALQLEALEKQAEDLTRQILPDQADTVYLDRHGAVDGVTRTAASSSVLSVQINGTPSTAVTWGTRVLVAPDGQRYTPVGTSATLSGAGQATISVTAQVPGSGGDQAVNTPLIWSTTPPNATQLATVLSITTPGIDEETDASYAARIIALRQERPGSGNRADWQAWVAAVTGVDSVYVYALVAPGTYTGNTLGCVTIIALGPKATDPYDPTFNRILSPTKLAQIKDYIEGIKDKDGNAVTDGVQLRPVTMSEDDYEIATVTGSGVSVTLKITQSAATAFPWTGSFVIDPSTSNTTRVDVTGDATALLNKPIAVYIGNGAIRGGYQVVTPTTATYNTPSAGKTRLSGFSSPLNDVPVAGSIYPAAPNDDEIRRAIFAYFDSLGPGDHTNPHSKRWPTEEQQGRATLYINRIESAAFVTGVLDVLCTLPVSNQTPAFGVMYKLSDLLIIAP